MSRAQTCASILGLGLMLSAASTEARELEFFVESRLGADSNVFRRADESELPETAGGVWELAPRLTVRDEQDELHYSLSYQPTHEQFFALEDGRDAGDISGFDHNANGTFEWMADPTTRINLDGSFFRQRRVREEFVGVPAAADPVLDASDNEYLQRGRGTLSFYRQLAPRFSVRASVSHDNFDAERSDQSDSISHSGSAGFDYSLAEHTKVGVTGTYRYRDTKASIDRNPLPPVPGNDNITYEEFRSNTQTVDLSFSLEQQVTEHLSVVLAAGPSFFQTRDEQSSARDPDPLFGGVQALSPTPSSRSTTTSPYSHSRASTTPGSAVVSTCPTSARKVAAGGRRLLRRSSIRSRSPRCTSRRASGPCEAASTGISETRCRRRPSSVWIRGSPAMRPRSRRSGGSRGTWRSLDAFSSAGRIGTSFAQRRSATRAWPPTGRAIRAL